MDVHQQELRHHSSLQHERKQEHGHVQHEHASHSPHAQHHQHHESLQAPQHQHHQHLQQHHLDINDALDGTDGSDTAALQAEIARLRSQNAQLVGLVHGRPVVVRPKRRFSKRKDDESILPNDSKKRGYEKRMGEIYRLVGADAQKKRRAMRGANKHMDHSEPVVIEDLKTGDKFTKYVFKNNTGGIPFETDHSDVLALAPQLPVGVYEDMKEDTACTYCGKVLSTRSARDIHERIHTGEKPFECLVCLRKFASSSEAAMHHYLHHSDEKKYVCDQMGCDMRFKTKKQREAHQEQAHGINRQYYTCQFCNKKLTSKYSLQAHLKGAPGGGDWICSVCNRGFRCKAARTQHRKTHGKRPFQCKQCSSSFASKNLLKVHQHIHTGAKPFKCDLCGKGFAQSSSRNKHRRIHTGERPFQCKQCGRAFVQSSQLMAHSKTHLKDRPETFDHMIHDQDQLRGVAHVPGPILEDHKPKHRVKPRETPALPPLPAGYSLAQLFAHLGIFEYVHPFVKEGVDVSVLPDLNDADFKELIPKIGPRRKLQRFIKDELLAGKDD